MNIIFFSHPAFMSHQSMPRFTDMLSNGMRKLGHQVEVLMPKAFFFDLRCPNGLKKWMSYIDQYIVFPLEVQKRLKRYPPDTLFVFTDHALGPWVPLVCDRFHVIHCHDFLAQQSALGEIPENYTRWPGRLYQNYIKKGYTQGKNFISVSYKTEKDLHKFLPDKSVNSKVVYNGLNNMFEPFDIDEARSLFGDNVGLDLSAGYLLHVGGNQWYKNRLGVIDIYDVWRTKYSSTLPLIMIGEFPSSSLREKYEESKYKKDIHFFSNIEDKYVRLAYAGASLFLFPSIAEGFGWPIAEAMACGCPVITTNEAPMTEVGDKAAFYIEKRPVEVSELSIWAKKSAVVIEQVLQLGTEKRAEVVAAQIENAKRFDTETALKKIESIYFDILAS